MIISKIRELQELLNKEVEVMDANWEKVLEISRQLDLLIIEYIKIKGHS